MGRFLIRRLLQMVPVLLGATFIVFAANFALPGDPVRALGGERTLPPEQHAAIVERYNLEDPLPVQYGKYVAGVVTGDLGESLAVRRGRDVSEVMADAFPITARLALVAFLVEVTIGVSAGIVAGIRRGSFLDTLVKVSTIAVVSIPIFLTALAAQLLFGLRLGWLPIAGTGQGWISYLLPGFVLGSLSLAYVARIMRTSLVETMGADYIRTATAKGLSRSRVIGRHALRNSLIPVVTFLAFDIGALMSGAIVTEGIFNLGGIGGVVFQGIRQQDGPVVVGIVTVLVIIFILANLLVDVLYAVLDPRIRYG